MKEYRDKYLNITSIILEKLKYKEMKKSVSLQKKYFPR